MRLGTLTPFCNIMWQDKVTDRQTERQADRQTDKQTDRQTDRDTETDRRADRHYWHVCTGANQLLNCLPISNSVIHSHLTIVILTFTFIYGNKHISTKTIL